MVFMIYSSVYFVFLIERNVVCSLYAYCGRKSNPRNITGTYSHVPGLIYEPSCGASGFPFLEVSPEMLITEAHMAHKYLDGSGGSIHAF